MKIVEQRLIPENDLDRRLISDIVCKELKTWELTTDKEYWYAEIKYKGFDYAAEESAHLPDENGLMGGHIWLYNSDDKEEYCWVDVIFEICALFPAMPNDIEFHVILSCPDFSIYRLSEDGYSGSFCIPMKRVLEE
jgi:hypothetical protein